MTQELYYRRMGDGEPVIILHGMYGSSDNWFTVGKALSENFEVYMLDQRNHGHSPHDPEISYPLLRDDLRDFLDLHDLWKVTIIGHSMGGKTAMFFAAAFPHRIKKLIIVDISPGSYKNLLKPSDLVLDHLNIIQSLLELEPEKIESRTGADLKLAETIKSIAVRQFLLKNLVRNKAGKFEWALNLDAIQKGLPALMDGIDAKSVEDGLKLTGFPVLFIRGGNSDYINAEEEVFIKKLFPDAQIKTIEGAGHWVHSEKTEEFIRVVKKFLL
jgi:pimeloyl-ACP methyl ester carboxylesterase